MIKHSPSLPEFLSRRARDAVGGCPSRGGVGLISGADGPTFFIASPQRRGRGWDNGCLLITPSPGALWRAAGVSAALVLTVAALSAVLHFAFSSERKR